MTYELSKLKHSELAAHDTRHGAHHSGSGFLSPDLDCYQAWITSQGPAQDHPQQSLPSLDEVHPTNIRVKCKLSKSSQGLGFFSTFLQKLNLLKIPKTQTGLPRM